MSLDHTRHSGIFDASEIKTALIGGGGIGAITAITLAKMGVKAQMIFDDDTVDEVNLATQFHLVSDVGLNKAESVCKQVKAYAGGHPIPMDMRVEANMAMSLFPRTADVYISAVDSIKSRKEIWKMITGALGIPNPMLTQRWYLDARMGAEVFELFVVNLANAGWYHSMSAKEDDADFPEIPCTSKATIYTADIAAGHIGATIRRIATWEQQPGILRHDILNNELSFLEI